ncbi:MAG TPA: addiction module toxin, HicA family [Candidatus Vogelbacteria bacterium]|nr:addiction module toxin, HicA family [Candidatus Vogelbacteria bacterium]HBC44317.1 addiction module toxin, HicA family [Candidatus Vogelbacteria bacterium]HCQ91833.1 addiction module toxin, HicA family [Candidatus Vogelbacteria bacterium]
MKRREFLSHLRANQCKLAREGAKHSIFRNASSGVISTVPRHQDISNILARKICRDLGIPHPKQS